MMKMESWIKLFRKIREWEWYQDSNTKDLFLEILLTANTTDKKWRGIEIKRGQLLTGRIKLSKLLGISEQSIRTSLTKLKSTNEITIKSTNKYTLITVNKFNDYQQLTNKSTNEQPTTNQQLTTTKEYKNVKNEKKNTYTDKNLTLEQVAEGILKAFKVHTGRNFKGINSFKNNLEYWLETYTPKDIENAIKQLPYDNWWADKMTPTMLFRRKNPQGEPVDYISQLSINNQNVQNKQ